MTQPMTPAEVMLEAAKGALRTGRFPPGEVIRHQLDALAEAGYCLEPHLDDGGAALMLAAAKRTFRAAHFAPAAVTARQLAAISAAGHAFVQRREGGGGACPTFQWGPRSFEACARCGLTFWKHAEGADHPRGSHRRV